VDIGTGSGKWVLEVAAEYPSTRVIGMDLSPIEPTTVPTNAEFIVEDVNQGTGLSDASTDLVHSRYHPPLQVLIVV
jgi:ubiquinone/menaquinone biosynthesis C-methylase UbiE